MEYKILDFKISDKIGQITINRPEALNALNSLFFTELDQMISEIEKIEQIRAVILTGSGKAFVAGADIAEMVDMDSSTGSAFSQRGQQVMARLGQMKVPVIAAVNGFALGGGCELAMACDFRIASTRAKFGQPEVSLGIIPGFAGTQRLSRLTGLGNALYLLLTGEMISAQQALKMGLVQKVVEPEELMAEVTKIAKTIAAKGPKAVKLVKEVTRNGLQIDLKTGSDLESEKFGTLFGNEASEGMKAFLAKREPNW